MQLYHKLILVTAALASVYADSIAQSGLVSGGQAQAVPGVPGVPGASGASVALGAIENTPETPQDKPAEVGYAPPQMHIAAQQYEANKNKNAADLAKVMDRQNSFAGESLELGDIDFDFSSDSEDSSSESDEPSSGSAKLSACMLYLLAATLTTLL